MHTPRYALAAAALAMIALSVSACGQPDSPDPAAAAETVRLIQARCTACHTAERIKKASFSEAGWRDMVERMRKNGADLSDEEAAEIAGFLAGGGASEL